jgi:hypothetical protein
MRQSVDEKQWLDVQTCAECFKQMVRNCTIWTAPVNTMA